MILSGSKKRLSADGKGLSAGKGFLSAGRKCLSPDKAGQGFQEIKGFMSLPALAPPMLPRFPR